MRFLLILIALMVLLTACASQQGTCQQDIRTCPDGSTVGRISPICEFAECVPKNDTPCNYTSQKRNYEGKSPEECKEREFTCAAGQRPFIDHCGCGCAAVSTS